MTVPTPRTRLQRIARAAMVERGLEPDFSQAAQGEADRLREPSMPAPRGIDGNDDIRDMRQLIWCSIDNDDSRDLDQLTVAEAVSAATSMIRVAVADVSELVRKDSPL